MAQELTLVYFSLGSNLGQRRGNLQFGLSGLQSCGELCKVSPVYETEPWGYTNTQAYLNIAAAMKTALDPEALMQKITAIEEDAGRKRNSGKKYEARTLDIDILFYGKEIIEKSDLKIPHPRLHLRNFVLVPLVDIAPDFVHPLLETTLLELKKETTDTSKIKRLAQRL